jgi:hypothetical protein
VEYDDAQILSEVLSKALDKDIGIEETLRISAIMKLFFAQGVDGFNKKVEIRQVVDRDAFVVSIPAHYFAKYDINESLGLIIDEISKALLRYSLKMAPGTLSAQSDCTNTYNNPVHQRFEQIQKLTAGPPGNNATERIMNQQHRDLTTNPPGHPWEKEPEPRSFKGYNIEPQNIMAETYQMALGYAIKHFKLVRIR